MLRPTMPRVPCADGVKRGLQAHMHGGKAGFFGEIVQTGSVQNGTLIWCSVNIPIAASVLQGDEEQE